MCVPVDARTDEFAGRATDTREGEKMAFVTWAPKYLIGHAQVDAEHETA